MREQLEKQMQITQLQSRVQELLTANAGFHSVISCAIQHLEEDEIEEAIECMKTAIGENHHP